MHDKSRKKRISVYYDTPEYALGGNDIWLRNIDGDWELTIPICKNEKSSACEYQSIKGEQNIRQVFGIPMRRNFFEDIAEFGYAPFCEIEIECQKNREGIFQKDRKKVLEFLKRKKPKHHKALLEAGILAGDEC